MKLKINDETKLELKEATKGLSIEVVEAVFNVINIFIKATPNKIDDLILMFLPKAKDFILDKLKSD